MLADFVLVQCDAVIANAVVDLMVCVIRDGLLGDLVAVLQFSVQVLSLKSDFPWIGDPKRYTIQFPLKSPLYCT